MRKIVSVVLLEHYLPTICKSVHHGTKLDILDLNFAYGLDVVSAFIFGISRSTNFIEDIRARQHWLATYLKSHSADCMFWLLELPTLTNWLSKFGIPVLPKWYFEAHDNLDQWALHKVDEAEAAIAKQPAKDMSAGDCPVLYSQLKLAIAEEHQNKVMKDKIAASPQQRLELASECLDHLGTNSTPPRLDV